MSLPSTTEAVTRCPCGDNDDQLGLMIQCEICSVWQHSECVGVTEETVPEKYYCDACMPGHPIHLRNRAILSALPSRSLSKDFAKLKKGYTKPVPTGERKRKKKEEEIKEETQSISREERKLKSILQTFERLENRGKRRGEDGGSGSKAAVKQENRRKEQKVDSEEPRRGRHKKGRQKGGKRTEKSTEGEVPPSPSSCSSSSPVSPPPEENGSFLSVSNTASSFPTAELSSVSTATRSNNNHNGSSVNGKVNGNGSSSRSRSSAISATSHSSCDSSTISSTPITPSSTKATGKRALVATRSAGSTRSATRSDERKSKTPKMTTAKTKRARAGQPPTEPSHWERRNLSPLTPLYLGRQRYILSCVKEDQRIASQMDPGIEGWRANLLDSSLPIRLRVLNALQRPI